jgi:hypothetical protein
MRAPRPPALLVLAVLLMHLLLGHEVQRIHDGWVSDGPPPMPERLQVALVREMQLQPPPAVVRRLRPAAEPPAALTPAARMPPDRPASAPELALDLTPLPDLVPDAPIDPTSAAPRAPEASAPADAEPGPEWPLSTRLSYVLTGNYRGPVHGQAQVEWLRQGRDYQVNLDVSLGPSFAPLLTRRMSSRGVLTPAGIAPQRYDEETKLVFSDARRATIQFLRGEVQLPTGLRVPTAPGAQDAASQFVQLTWLFLTDREPLRAGHAVRFPLVLPRRPYDWQYEVVGEETLNTPLGPLAAWHLKPSQPAGAGDLNAEVWLAPALQYLPVRLVIRQDADTYIDLMLRSVPLQAAPESTNDIPRRLPP